MNKPRLLDMYCGAGGAAMGYYRAGFEVVGIDLKPQEHFPFEFHQADALTYPLEGFDAYHASPPCQRFSIATRAHPGLQEKYPDLIGATRIRLQSTGRPFVIENVPQAPLLNAFMLCGTMFGLRVKRHRLFECLPPLYWAPTSCSCRNAKTQVGYHIQPSFARGAQLLTVAGNNFCAADGREALGIDWMTRDELAQAIPPAFTEYIGKWLIKAVK